jgi:hypothetical protein
MGFSKDGKVLIYDNFNQRFWKINNGYLSLFDGNHGL